MTNLSLTRDQIAAIQAWAENGHFVSTLDTDIPALCAQALRAIELDAAKKFADAAAKEFNENGGASGFALARLTDLRTAIRNAEQTGAGKQ